MSHNREAQLHFEESQLRPLSWVMLHPIVVPITYLVNREFCANIKTWLMVSASLFTSKQVTWSPLRLQNISISGLYKLGRDCLAETAFIHVNETSSTFEGRSSFDLAWSVRFFFSSLLRTYNNNIWKQIQVIGWTDVKASSAWDQSLPMTSIFITVSSAFRPPQHWRWLAHKRVRDVWYGVHLAYCALYLGTSTTWRGCYRRLFEVKLWRRREERDLNAKYSVALRG